MTGIPITMLNFSHTQHTHCYIYNTLDYIRLTTTHHMMAFIMSLECFQSHCNLIGLASYQLQIRSFFKWEKNTNFWSTPNFCKQFYRCEMGNVCYPLWFFPITYRIQSSLTMLIDHIFDLSIPFKITLKTAVPSCSESICHQWSELSFFIAVQSQDNLEEVVTVMLCVGEHT